ncbi:hypothetical protein, partial [Nocardioides sp. YIM 152588]|uniref:hypothetical protein n=1 Tax=Nocardioides sp. YIM 152588 TaxID=3158259 RepID=UPI0032E4E18A
MGPEPVPADDLGERPWAYPGAATTGPGLLTGDSYLPLGDVGPGGADGLLDGLLDRLLDRLGATPLAGRVAVLAVGSNASPGVLGPKLVAAGVAPVVPFVVAGVDGLAVGHSAHVSRPGFVPAAPFPAPGAVGTAVAGLLDADQLRCLDATEPNYVRRPVARVPRALPGAVRRHGSDHAFVYCSRWGVIAPPGAAPLPLMGQAALLRLLDGALPGLGLLGAGADAPSALRRLAAE